MGAYVAKAAAVSDPPDVPPGWAPAWPFPAPGDLTPTVPGGPAPPGYVYEYSIPMTGVSALIDFDGSVTPTVTLYDHETYETPPLTGNPPIPSVTWTATLGGDVIGIRFSGDTEYETSLNSAYTKPGDFYLSTKEIEFELGVGNRGNVVTLSATSLTGGQEIGDFAYIEINVEMRATITFNYTLAGSGGAVDEGGISINTRGTFHNIIYDLDPRHTSVGSANTLMPKTITGSHSASIELNTETGTWINNLGNTFKLNVEFGSYLTWTPGSTGTLSVSVVVYVSGQVFQSDSRSLVVTADEISEDPVWVTQDWFIVNRDSITIL